MISKRTVEIRVHDNDRSHCHVDCPWLWFSGEGLGFCTCHPKAMEKLTGHEPNVERTPECVGGEQGR